mgnify:CR=1 FL=1
MIYVLITPVSIEEAFSLLISIQQPLVYTYLGTSKSPIHSLIQQTLNNERYTVILLSTTTHYSV